MFKRCFVVVLLVMFLTGCQQPEIADEVSERQVSNSLIDEQIDKLAGKLLKNLEGREKIAITFRNFTKTSDGVELIQYLRKRLADSLKRKGLKIFDLRPWESKKIYFNSCCWDTEGLKTAQEVKRIFDSVDTLLVGSIIDCGIESRITVSCFDKTTKAMFAIVGVVIKKEK